MNKAIILQGSSYEALYVNGKLIQEGKTLNGEFNREDYFKALAYNYGFDKLEWRSADIDENNTRPFLSKEEYEGF
mgnify:CR=1 FL=1